MSAPTPPRLHRLSAAGVQLLLLERPQGLPELIHFGADLGADLGAEHEADLGQPHDLPDAAELLRAGAAPVPRSALDEPWPLTLLPGEPDGWSGRPALAAHRGGRAVVPRWTSVVLGAADGLDPGVLRVEATDPAAGVSLLSQLRLDAAGVLQVSHTLTNTGPDVLDVASLLAVVPLPVSATETLDLTGRWCRERSPQRLPLVHGGRVRESRRGRTGHDATLLLLAGEAGFGFGHGELAAVHVAWSGDHVHLVDRLPEGAGRHAGVLGGGELLRAGEVRLGQGEAYTAPPVLFTHASDGLDGVSARMHEHVRARAGHPRTERPVTLNVWEAVYFDHDHDRLAALVDTAAGLGVERVVLDDGWFLGRRDDTAGLGDWEVDPEVWPGGLHAFSDRVRGHGMQVGLWVEPEMVNLDSDLVRAHPDWLLGARPGPDGTPGGTRAWRTQQVLDLTRADAFQHVLGRLDAVVTAERPDYLKWDHNRDLHEALDADGSPAVRRQTRAAYRLMAELQARHPGLEIESCSSGGARVDLGVLEHTQRVWASDCNDALERQSIQRWTAMLLPPELVGTHVGPPRSHTTGRVADLDLRCLTALFGHAGIEWDVTSCSEAELERLAGWIALHTRLRPLLHSGRTVRTEERDGAWAHGVVSPDRRHAVFAFVRLTTGADVVPGLLRLPGLEAGTRYLVRAIDVTGREDLRVLGSGIGLPPWCDAEGVTLTGAVLALYGLAMPVLDPEAGILIEATALG